MTIFEKSLRLIKIRIVMMSLVPNNLVLKRIVQIKFPSQSKKKVDKRGEI